MTVPKEYIGAFMTPCGVESHLQEYLEDKSGVVFHFGTGGHHTLGLSTLKNTELFVIGLTASIAEFIIYTGLCREYLGLEDTYRVLYADIYRMSPKEIPKLDFASLPHLGHYRERWGSSVRRRSDEEVLELFIASTKVGGEVILFRGDEGYSVASGLARRSPHLSSKKIESSVLDIYTVR